MFNPSNPRSNTRSFVASTMAIRDFSLRRRVPLTLFAKDPSSADVVFTDRRNVT